MTTLRGGAASEVRVFLRPEDVFRVGLVRLRAAVAGPFGCELRAGVPGPLPTAGRPALGREY
jgi:hypothetical protein